jgi:hypothetical protein
VSEPNQMFSAQSLGWMRKRNKQYYLEPDIGDYPQTEDEWSAFLTQLQERVTRDTFEFSRTRTMAISKRGGSVFRRTVLCTSSLDETLVLRKINDNLRRAYGIKPVKRNDLLQLLKQAIAEPTPKTLIRIDIKSCFESINRKRLIEKIIRDGNVSFQTISLLKKLFISASSKHPRITKLGIPRGVIVSSTLAEIFLIDLDRDMRSINGVYLLLRYVDDILIFATRPYDEIAPQIADIIKKYGLTQNPDKAARQEIGCGCAFVCHHKGMCPCAGTCKCVSSNPHGRVAIEYLGYEIHFSPHNASKKTNEVALIFSDRKVKKIMSRFSMAAREYVKTGNDHLLEDRLKYIVGNQRVLHSGGHRGIFSGIAYTHSEYCETGLADLSRNTISAIDLHRRRVIRKAFAYRPLIKAREDELLSISVNSGFYKKRRTKFTAARVKQIARCWKDV